MKQSENTNSPSQYCKSQGLSSMVELSELCNKPKTTLNDWWNDNRELFICVVAGAVSKKSSK